MAPNASGEETARQFTVQLWGTIDDAVTHIYMI